MMSVEIRIYIGSFTYFKADNRGKDFWTKDFRTKDFQTKDSRTKDKTVVPDSMVV